MRSTAAGDYQVLDRSVQPARIGRVTSAQPVTVKGRETRERIIRAAAELVAERGVAGTSLDDVRGRAHVIQEPAVPLLCRPRRSDASGRACRQRRCHRRPGRAVRAARHDRRPARLGRRARDPPTDAPRAGGCPIGSLAGQLAEHDEGARLELADGLDRWEAAIRDGLERMAARGELRTRRRPQLLAQRTLAAVQGGLLLTQIRRDPSSCATRSTARSTRSSPRAPRRKRPTAHTLAFGRSTGYVRTHPFVAVRRSTSRRGPKSRGRQSHGTPSADPSIEAIVTVSLPARSRTCGVVAAKDGPGGPLVRRPEGQPRQ